MNQTSHEHFTVPKVLITAPDILMSLTLPELRVYLMLCYAPSRQHHCPLILHEFLRVTSSLANQNEPQDFTVVYKTLTGLVEKGLLEMRDAPNGFACILRHPWDKTITHPAIFVVKP